MRGSKEVARRQIERGLRAHSPRGRTVGQMTGYDATGCRASMVREILDDLAVEGKVRVATRPYPNQPRRPPFVEYFWIPEAPAPAPGPAQGRAGGAVRMDLIRCAYAAKRGGPR